MTAQNPQQKPSNILIVDDSEVFRLMVWRDLVTKGFTELAPSVYGRDGARVYVVGNYASAMIFLERNSAQRIDFDAVFLDWHLSTEDRAADHDVVQIAVAALDDKNQPLKPTIYCISSEAQEMKDKIQEIVEPLVVAVGGTLASLQERIVLVEYMAIAAKILEVAGWDGSSKS